MPSRNRPPGSRGPRRNSYLETLCGTDSGHQVFVVTVSDEVVGFVTYSLDEKKQLSWERSA